MKLLRRWILPLVIATAAFAAKTPDPAKPDEKKSTWVFSLLPKSMQQNPNLDLTVITEMSEAGKARPPASPQKPVYYLAQSAGYKALGEVSTKENQLTEADVEPILRRSLAAAGFLPAKDPEHPATLVITYVWGSHNLFNEPDPDLKTQSPEKVMRNVLDRAALVGGEKFAKELLQLFIEADALAGANKTIPVNDPDGLVQPIDPVLGQAQMDFANPVQLFKQRSAKNEFLVDQAVDDCFYVVASAYDYKSIVEKKKILLWRTRMTANSKGVSQQQSLPTLIASAGPYFGKEMTEPEVLVKRSTPDGKVEIGTATVIDSTPSKESPKK